jgi:AcrR family transcriptional regulator
VQAGRIAAGEHGFQGLRVDDIVQVAGTSHGTFYLYFSSREDLLDALIHDALSDMDTVVSAFPRVIRGEHGRADLRAWVGQFCTTYAQHAVALRLLSSADAGDHRLQRSGLRLLWRLADAIALGMGSPGGPASPGRHPEFTALCCAMMLERMCYLLSVGAAMPPGDALERMTVIMMAAFAGPYSGNPRRTR